MHSGVSRHLPRRVWGAYWVAYQLAEEVFTRHDVVSISELSERRAGVELSAESGPGLARPALDAHLTVGLEVRDELSLTALGGTRVRSGRASGRPALACTQSRTTER
jgi:hypothetical protein